MAEFIRIFSKEYGTNGEIECKINEILASGCEVKHITTVGHSTLSYSIIVVFDRESGDKRMLNE